MEEAANTTPEAPERSMEDKVASLFGIQDDPEPVAEKQEPESAEPTLDDLPPEPTAPVGEEIELVYNGTPIRKSIDDVRALAQQGMLYQNKQEQFEGQWAQAQKLAEVAQNQAKIQPELMESIGEARALSRQLEQYQNVDWVSLAQQDAQAYLTHQAQYNAIRQKTEQAQRKAQELYQKSQENDAQMRHQIVQREWEKTTQKLPHWKNPETFSKDKERIVSYLKERGYDDAAIGSIADSRHLLIAYDAARYRELEKSRSEKLKKVTELPKVVKPGQGKTIDSKQQQEQDYRKSLRAAKTDNEKAKVIQQRLEAKFG